MEQGQTTGTVTATASASSLNLGTLESLFADMSAALASPSACASDTTGIRRSLATNVQLSLGDGTATGRDDVSAGLCAFFGSGDDGQSPIWGSRFVSPTLGHCDLSGSAPACGVSFVLQNAAGDVDPVGSGMAVTQEGGVWKFMGDLLPIEIEASAKAQRNERIDGDTPSVNYSRALAFEVAAAPGLECAKVSQHAAGGVDTTVGYYKTDPGAVNQVRLSLWMTNGGADFGASLDPAVGTTNGPDNTWIALPEGDAGDAVIRNFYRGGRTVQVSLFSDRGCLTPFAIGGKSVFDVDVDGVPPVWSALPTLPWPAIDATTRSTLQTVAIDAGATASVPAAWTFSHGPLGLKDVSLCVSDRDCGKDGIGRIASKRLSPSALGVQLSVQNLGAAVAASDSKRMTLFGRTGEGVDLATDFSSCPALPAGQICH